MREKAFIIIGAGLLQIPVIKESLRKGFYTVVIDRNPQAAGIKLADEWINCDIADYNACVRAAAGVHAHRKAAGVITVGTDFSRTAAAVAARLNLPGIDFQTADKATDKIKMRKVFNKNSLPQPAFYPVLNAQDLATAARQLDFPLVIKPADSMGARGVQKCSSAAELETAYKSAAAFSRSNRVIVEEYIAGNELSIDALVWKGKIYICGVADRIIEYPPYFVETGHIMPSRLDHNLLKDAENLFKRGITALGIKDGAAKGDIRIDKYNNTYIGEIAARLSGGFMSGFTYPYATGVNLTANALAIAAGQPPPDLKEKKAHCAIEKAIIAEPGYISSISGIEQAQKLPGVKNIFLKYKPGTAVTTPKNNVEKGGNVIVAAADYNKALTIVNKVFNTINIEIKQAG